MVSQFYSYFLDSYESYPIKQRMKAKYGFTGMLAGFVFITIALVSHLVLDPKPFLLAGDFIAISSLIFGAFVLKRGQLANAGLLFLFGSFSLIFVQTAVADGYFNDDSVSHIFHFFQTLALSSITLMIFSLMATHKWHIYLGSTSAILLVIMHIFAFQTNPYLQFGGGGVIVSIVVFLELGFALTSVLLSFGLSNDLLMVNEQKSDFIARQGRELEKRANELERKNNDLRIFAYSMSHDLKEPLRMVGSFSSLLKREISKEKWNEEAIKEYAQFAVDGSIKMEKQINNLLTYIQLNNQQQDQDWVNLDNIVLGLRSVNLKVLIEENDAEVIFEGNPVIYGMKQQLEQILQNLISNAIKYKQENVKPRISIISREEDNGYYINITDNGSGIPIGLQNKIFEVFQRVENQNSDYSGTGIGLAICRRVMENHKGSITLSSEVGKGSTFHLFFPKPSAKVRSIKGVA